MSRMIVGSTGFYTSICESCNSQDCSNPIEKTEVSILGVSKKIKIYSRGITPRLVVQCEGFMP
jgi:hypothetical protein